MGTYPDPPLVPELFGLPLDAEALRYNYMTLTFQTILTLVDQQLLFRLLCVAIM